jgi:hypothetical protein
MRARLAGLIAAVAVALTLSPVYSATADGPVCPSGTNWDHSLQICR